MKTLSKFFRTILAIIVVPFFLWVYHADAATLYSQTGTGTTYSISAPNYALYYQVGNTTTTPEGTPPPPLGTTVWYTATAPVVSVWTPANSVGCSSVTVTAQYSGIGQTAGIGVSDSGGCLYTFATPIATSSTFTNMQFSNVGIPVNMDGSTSNAGHTFIYSGGLVGSGGPAFYLLSSGGLTPPTSSITPVAPISVTLTGNPVSFVTTQTRYTDTCFKEITYEIQASSSLMSLYIPPYQFSSCPLSAITDIATTTVSLPIQGSYSWRARLEAFNTASSSAWTAWSSFDLATSTTSSTNFLNAPAQITCDTFDLTCYIKQAFVWLLYPSQGFKTSYDSMITTLEARPPVAYFYIVRNNLQGLNASSTPAATITIPSGIKTNFFNPVDTALSSLLWAFFAFLFYKRLKHITL